MQVSCVHIKVKLSLDACSSSSLCLSLLLCITLCVLLLVLLSLAHPSHERPMSLSGYLSLLPLQGPGEWAVGAPHAPARPRRTLIPLSSPCPPLGIILLPLSCFLKPFLCPRAPFFFSFLFPLCTISDASVWSLVPRGHLYSTLIPSHVPHHVPKLPFVTVAPPGSLCSLS